MAFRLMFYISERDLGVHGYSDDPIINRPLYIGAVLAKAAEDGYTLQYYDDTLEMGDWTTCTRHDKRWDFPLTNLDFRGTFAIEVEAI